MTYFLYLNCAVSSRRLGFHDISLVHVHFVEIQSLPGLDVCEFVGFFFCDGLGSVALRLDQIHQLIDVDAAVTHPLLKVFVGFGMLAEHLKQ